ncbi:hypothetical protein JANAI62_17830 [Jannaschia pagri]|uniref:DUF3306 domain-containing protein n=1 Tax=Jannaschia pagri TaxID=2829797 RepID=A0ABQ4NLQ3_9RHOB|nr:MULTISPECIES: DUF3306 domain-containing protein [unclassified Jannaschia]GIT91327.1 hypothetical protein JANAI61_17850 [Jannaschia sp. AI_61]GIT95160.1 hypothetical protein JANAI62_17830 [Jannaschia sp. AI_62]
MSDFWSRRKAAVEAEATAEVEAVAVRAADADRADLEAQTDEEVLAHFDLPVPEDADDPAVLRKFLTDTMPARLKSRALRRMWRLNPVLANLDGLVDYGEDFTDAATVVENMATTYQVGKGMLKALLHETPAPVEVVEDDPAPDDAPDDTPEVTQETSEELVAAAPMAAPQPAPTYAAPEDTPAPVLPRRMRFSVAGTPA